MIIHTNFQTVNNKPYETSKRLYWCQDGARTGDAGDFSCKMQYDITTGERIWDSQVCTGSISVRDKISILMYIAKQKKREGKYREGRGQVQSTLVLPYLTLPYLTLPYLTLPYLTLPYLTLPYLTLPYLTLPYLTLPYLTLPYLTLPYPTLPFLTFIETSLRIVQAVFSRVFVVVVRFWKTCMTGKENVIIAETQCAVTNGIFHSFISGLRTRKGKVLTV